MHINLITNDLSDQHATLTILTYNILKQYLIFTKTKSYFMYIVISNSIVGIKVISHNGIWTNLWLIEAMSNHISSTNHILVLKYSKANCINNNKKKWVKYFCGSMVPLPQLYLSINVTKK